MRTSSFMGYSGLLMEGLGSRESRGILGALMIGIGLGVCCDCSAILMGHTCHENH